MSDVLTVWRIVHEAYLDSAFSGSERSCTAGDSTAPVTKPSIPRARSRLPFSKCSCRPTRDIASINTGAFRRRSRRRAFSVPMLPLPHGWDAIPYGRASQDFGDQMDPRARTSRWQFRAWWFLRNGTTSSIRSTTEFERVTIGEANLHPDRQTTGGSGDCRVGHASYESLKR
jgi:hypothetical protein